MYRYQKNRPWAEGLTIVLQIGLTVAGSIFFCFFLGRWIDGHLGSRGIFTVLFLLFGVGGGATVAYRQIMETLAHGPKAPK